MEVNTWYFANVARTDNLKRLSGGGGPLMQKILSDMNDFVEGKEQTIFFMYSAHDSTVATNFQVLGNYNGYQPPYASAIIYELYNVSNSYEVKILYQNYSSFAPSNNGLNYFEVPSCP